MATWRFKVRGKQRQAINRGMLVQALIELGRQLAREAEEAQQQAGEQEQARHAKSEASP